MKEISPGKLQITRDELGGPELRGFVIVSAVSAGNGVYLLEGFVFREVNPVKEDGVSATDSSKNLNE